MEPAGQVQPGILDSIPPLAAYLLFSLKPGSDPRPALTGLRETVDGNHIVAGVGESVVSTLELSLEGMRSFPRYSGPVPLPDTPFALWFWLRGNDRGELVHRIRAIERIIGATFQREKTIHGFCYGNGLDLSGYEDGTENPQGQKAIDVAVVDGLRRGMTGSSFVAVQQWVHDLDYLQSLPADEQDNIIGRRKSDNRELQDAPESAHVKRTAQENFDPEAFLLRRSMPWADETSAGLMFVAFGKTFDPFDAQLKRMMGMDDGTVDALFRFSRPVSGSYFWCPPILDGVLDLSVLGIE